MTVTAKNIVPIKTAEVSLTTQYTASNVTAIIDKFTATNRTASSANLTVHLVNTSGAAAVDNIIVKEQILEGGETYTFPEICGHILNAGASIATQASVGAALNIRVSGREIS